MFSIRQKREISEAVQQILAETKHPELPKGEISFQLHVAGAESWSWADIKNNGEVDKPNVNPWNESQDVGKRITQCHVCQAGIGEPHEPICSVGKGLFNG